MLLWPTVPAASSAAFGFPWFLPLAGRFWQGPRQIILAAVCVFGMRLVVWGGGVAQAVSTESRGGGGHVGDRASRVPITPLSNMDVLKCAFLHLDH